MKKTIDEIREFQSMFETISWVQWDDDNFYKNPLQINLMDLLLRDLSIIFYQYHIQLSVIINNILNYIAYDIDSVIDILNRHDSNVQLLYSTLRKQKLISTDRTPNLVFMPTSPLMNFCKCYKANMQNEFKKKEMSLEMEDFSVTFMADARKNVPDLENFIARDNVTETGGSVFESPTDSIVPSPDQSPVFHSSCVHRSSSCQSKFKLGENRNRSLVNLRSAGGSRTPSSGAIGKTGCDAVVRIPIRNAKTPNPKTAGN